MLDRPEIVCKVLSTLDYLKLCSDHHEPTGEGVPVDITIMPDFVVDVDGAVIHLLNESADQAPSRVAAPEIGSRAGRVLSILAHLRDIDDDAYRLHYIAKTGHIGRAVLRERLQSDLKEHGLQPVGFPYLIPARQTRFAILGRDAYKKSQRQIVRPTSATRMTPHELRHHFYQPLEKIRTAKALYFSTDTLTQFTELVDLALLGESSEDGGRRKATIGACLPGFRFVFLDLAAIHLDQQVDQISNPCVAALRSAVQRLSDAAEGGDALAQRTRLTVILNEDQLPAREASLEQTLFSDLGLSERKDTLLIVGCAGDISWSDGVNGGKADTRTNPNRPDAREAFVAGVMLYRAVGSAWSAIPRATRLRHRLQSENDWTRSLFPDPYDRAAPREFWRDTDDEWAFMTECWPLDQAVRFGEALAKLWQGVPTGLVPDRRALLLENRAADSKRLTTFSDSPDSYFVDFLPRQWFKEVLTLEAEFARQREAGAGELKRLIDYLTRIAQGEEEDTSGASLLEHPSDWTSNQALVLRLPSWHIVQAQLAMRVLRGFAARRKKPLALLGSNTAYLTDLDGTLLRSSHLRATCLKNAFLALLIDPAHGGHVQREFPLLPEVISPRDLDFCARLFHLCVYRQYRYWACILRDYPYYDYGAEPNFRQVWNHRLSYPVFLWMLWRLARQSDVLALPESPRELILDALQSPRIRTLNEVADEQAISHCREILTATFDIREREDVQSTLEIRNDEALHRFFKTLARVDTRYKRHFEDAAARYWCVEYEPLANTRECLRTVRDVLGARLYVATEGHHDTQLRKITALGLDDFFPAMTVLSTGAAASTHEDLRNVRDAATLARDLRRRHEETRKEIGDDARLADAVRAPIDEREAAEIRRLAKAISFLELYEDQWLTFEDKTREYIYALIVASVLVEPDSPFLALTDLWQLVDRVESGAENVRTTRFAMVGDRESKDIRPIHASCTGGPSGPRGARPRRVTTVRMLTPDHQTEDIYWADGSGAEAQLVTWTASQIALALQRKDSWREPLDYRTMPPILGARLAGQGGAINEEILQALAWGRERGEEIGGRALMRSLSLINFLVARSTIRDEHIDEAQFLQALQDRLTESRLAKDMRTYVFLLNLLSQIPFETAYMPDGKRGRLASTVREAICREFAAEPTPEVEKICLREADKAFRILANPPSSSSPQGPQCPPPSEECVRLITAAATFGALRNFHNLFREWKAAWESR